MYLPNRTGGKSLPRLFIHNGRNWILFGFLFFQEDICTMYPCANNGQCVPEGHSRRCICSSPYYGEDCREGKPSEVRHRSIARIVVVHRPKPCDNVYCGYGQCRDGICECHSGYTGARCDIPRKFVQRKTKASEKDV